MTGPRGRLIGTFLIAIFISLWAGAACVFWAECEQEKASNGHKVAAVVHESAGESRPHDPGMSIYRGLQLFHLHDTHWPEPQSNGARAVRYGAAAYALAFPAILFGWFFQGGLARLLHQLPWGRFVVVAGEVDGARQLALDIARNKHRVVWARKRRGHDAQEDDGEGGVLVIEGNLDDAEFWQNKVCLDRASDIVVMAEDDATNIELSLTLEGALRGKHPGNSIRCHIQLADLHLKKGLVQLLPTDAECGSLTRCYFNQYEIMARLLARQHPLPVDIAETGGLGEHYIIVGFDQLGQNVALKLVKMGQQVVRRQGPAGPVFEVCKPRITVVDKRGDKAAEVFLRAHPGFKQTCHFNVIPADCTEREFLELAFLKTDGTVAHTSLIFCLTNEATVVSTILMMLDICERPEKNIDAIYYHAAHEEGVGHLLHKEQSRLSQQIPIITFAPEKEVFTEDVILNRSLDVLAERVHREYVQVTESIKDVNNPAPAASKTWMALTEEEREGNREPVDHLWAKLRTLGYNLETLPLLKSTKHLPPDEDTALIQEAIGCHMEELASSEHYRWMAWRLINGWTYGSTRDNTRKLHPDMVAYGQLREADKEKDRAIVRIIPELIKKGRLRVAKIVGVSESTR